MSNKPIVRKKPNVLPPQRRYAPTHQTSEPDPNDRYVVRDKDWEAVWGTDLTLDAAKALKERVAGSGKSRTVRFELMPTDPAFLAELKAAGWPIGSAGEVHADSECLVVPPPAPVQTAPVPAPARRTGNGTRPVQNRPPAPDSFTQQAAAAAARSTAAAAAAQAQARAIVAVPVATVATDLAQVGDAVDDLAAALEGGGEAGVEPTTLTPEQIADAEALADELDQMPMDELLGP